MSVSFYVPGAPTSTVYDVCEFDGCCESNRCGYCFDGNIETSVSEAPELNFSNANARALLRLLGRHSDDLSGHWTSGELVAVRSKIFTLRNSPSKIQEAVRETEEGERFTAFGLDEAGIIERLGRLEAVVVYACSQGLDVTWS